MIVMKPLLPAVMATFLLVGCTTSDTAEVQPIPGSITYGGQPRTKLTKSPPGSVIHNSFYDSTGSKVLETYILQPDRTLKLTRREIIPDFPM
jgi:hypothetical protein